MEREEGDRVALLALDEGQGADVGAVREEALAVAEHDREDHQAELVDDVDEVVGQQRLHESGAAGDEYVVGEPLLETILLEIELLKGLTAATIALDGTSRTQRSPTKGSVEF